MKINYKFMLNKINQKEIKKASLLDIVGQRVVIFVNTIEKFFERRPCVRLGKPTTFDCLKHLERTIEHSIEPVFFARGQIVGEFERIYRLVRLHAQREALPNGHATRPYVRANVECILTQTFQRHPVDGLVFIVREAVIILREYVAR